MLEFLIVQKSINKRKEQRKEKFPGQKSIEQTWSAVGIVLYLVLTVIALIRAAKCTKNEPRVEIRVLHMVLAFFFPVFYLIFSLLFSGCKENLEIKLNYENDSSI